MRKRLIQIFGFLITSLGWLFVLCTMAMDYWRITQLGGQGGSFIIKVAWYWSNLWKDCFTDSTAVTNCRDFPVLWSVTPFVQGVRGLLMCGLTLGFFGVVLCFLGMECTYIGGADKTKDKMLFAGAVFHFAGGVSDLAGYCLYINRIARTTFAPSVGPGVLRPEVTTSMISDNNLGCGLIRPQLTFPLCFSPSQMKLRSREVCGQKYDLGPPIFLGLVGCFFIFLGAVFYAVTVCRVLCPESKVVYAYGGRTYMAPRSGGRTLYTGYYRPSRQYGSYLGSSRSSSSKISKISQTTPTKNSERDAFV